MLRLAAFATFAATFAATVSATPRFTRGDVVDPGMPVFNETLPITLLGSPDIFAAADNGALYKHVVVLSFDGMHQSDLVYYVKTFPQSAFASILTSSIEFTNAKASSPSDSFPATAAIFTGASSRTHGLYYDVSYDKALYAAGSDCKGTQGTVVAWDESVDLNPELLNAGGSLNVSTFPLKKTTWGACLPVYPYDWPLVNTVFEVVRQSGLVTAYADKHPSYTWVNGPSGLGLSQSFFPEVASISGEAATEGFDDLHWSAITNWTMGLNYDGTSGFSTPAFYATNFQALTSAESSAGYNADLTPSNNLTQAYRQLDAKLADFITTMKAAGTYSDTLLILTAKQGQSPIDPATINIISDVALANATGVSIEQASADDGAVIWLTNPTEAASAKAGLLADAVALGIEKVWIGEEIRANGLGNAFSSRTPDVIVIAKAGVIYGTVGSGTKAQHGGMNFDDKQVPLIVHSPSFTGAVQNTEYVSTRQIPTTILKALGLDPLLLAGARAEGTVVLPGVPL